MQLRAIKLFTENVSYVDSARGESSDGMLNFPVYIELYDSATKNNPQKIFFSNSVCVFLQMV